jgi:hypothetical protein
MPEVRGCQKGADTRRALVPEGVREEKRPEKRRGQRREGAKETRPPEIGPKTRSLFETWDQKASDTRWALTKWMALGGVLQAQLRPGV